MAVIITDNRTLVDEADTTTDWSSPVAGEALTLFTTDPSPVESTASIGMAVSTETSDIVHTLAASADLTDTLVYVWVLANGTMDTTANGGIQLALGDGTDLIGYHVAGSDAAAFRHEDGPVGWQCLLIDTGSLPTTTTVLSGVLANLTITAITQIGAVYKTLSKALGGAANCFTDIIRYGNGGLTITGGGTGTEGKFSEIAASDRSTTTGTAWGIIRELGTGLFGVQGPIQFGDSAGTGSIDFEDTNQTVVFEDRGIGTNKYGYTITGNGTGTTSFILGTRDGVGLGSAGCTLTCPTGVGAFFTASSANIGTLGLYGCTISGFDRGVTFATTGTTNHEIFSTTFSGCSQVTMGTVEFNGVTFENTTSTGTAEAAVLLNSTTNVSNLNFVSGGTGHAIEISDATNSPFTFTNFTYEGYAATDGGTGNEVLVNTSGSPITINVTGGDTPTVDTTNSTGTVTINNNVSVTVDVQDVLSNGTNLNGALVYAYRTADDTLFFSGTASGGGTGTPASVTASVAASTEFYLRVRQSNTGDTVRYVPIETLGNSGSTGTTVTVTMVEDENI